ncbi:TetR/AcrR family transcriptional regulator [Streptomyces sp. RFCAC02]|uniref:TetR/AcrR family transcriptional regulator n=1 Tax=Streptomyces sp. RFCAC02 TaxID=2499143 RepID=UPI00101F3F23|nr:TetR/AcrR family transcriptional regulator [Streptomyces sp. RFCAC02]
MPTPHDRPTPAPATPGPGRPRSEESRLAILRAAVALLTEKGWADLTIEGIARRAGCGKQTIYRWWPTKADVLMDAALAKGALYVTVADHGSYGADLRAFLRDTYALASRPEVNRLLRALMAQSLTDEEFGARFRSRFLAQRRAALRVVVDRAARRGDLPDRPAPATVPDLVFGVLWYRVLTTDEPLDEPLVAEVLAALNAG